MDEVWGSVQGESVGGQVEVKMGNIIEAFLPLTHERGRLKTGVLGCQ